jgi:hypothetical protein
MASILDDLKGILSPAEFAKLEASEAVKTRIARGDELRSYYDGDPDPVTPPQNRSDPPPVRATPPPQFDLSSIETLLDRKLGTINTTIETKINETIQARGTELVNNAVGIAMRQADELNRVYHRHSAEFGEAFDSTAFNEFLMKPENSLMNGDQRGGSKFPTVTSAYEAMVGPKMTEKTIAAEVEKRVKQDPRVNTPPGTTPPSAVNSNIVKFMKRGGPADGAPATGASRAAAMLDRMDANRNSAAS